ncbi:ClcB-like voltage-gated chloride channel protein [Massilia sp. 9096]|uniref:ClcB-like voltage-gated chloride channel protein n=1 Tax=Massilia sp. 9096 TaxID=1500894 RepID=UPI0005601C1D|nr:ClcB-like voltage-gated chloride channel protein [Massilia sp. 9096]
MQDPTSTPRQRLRRLTGMHAMLLWAALAGLAGALATIAFRDGLATLQRLLVGHDGSFVDMAAALPWPVRIAMPCLGGVVAGAVLVWARRLPGTKPPDYMEAITVGDGRVPIRQTLLRSVSSMCTIASGGSIGREGPMVQLAALCASLVGRAARFDAARLRLLAACGAAAGIASAYNAPIASAFFITEIVLGTIAIDTLGPMMIAAVVANVTMRRFPGYKPVYEMPPFPDVALLDVAWFALLGILAGLLAPQFLRLLRLASQGFQQTRLPAPLRLGLGGLGVGVISVWAPQVWGNGYEVVNALLHQHWLWSAVLAILLLKVAATLCTVGSGAVGGIFTPTLFVGAALGQVFGQAVHALWPAAAASAAAGTAYTIVGMGAFLAAATGAPLMAILLIFEMTLSYQVMLPLMLACVIAYFLARSLNGPSMYEITARHRRDEEARSRLRATQMHELIRPAETVLPLDAGMDEMLAMFGSHPVKYLYVVDADERYQGVVALRDLAAQPPGSETRLARDFVRRDTLPLVTPGMSLAEASRQFQLHHGERLPAVKSEADPLLLGVVYKTALLDAFARLQPAELPGLRS